MIAAETRARLFVPEAYAAADPAAIVHAWPFAQLVTTSAGGEIHATATPLYFEADGDHSRLIGHVAARNGQAATLVEGAPVLALFNGPHAYISSRWYHDLPQVPTWDYVAAHVRGRIEPIDDAAGARAVLERVVAMEEAGAAEPWRLDHAPEGRVAKLLPMIRAFRIHVDWLEGVTKLNQTHPATDRARIVTALSGRGESHEDAIARLIAGLPE
jgi:transcriptional regulator